jgi:ADP-ribose pyrophosphatase YjhB (NUDIX family)
MQNETPQWLKWAREIEAIGQTGLHFSTNDFDRQRYGRMVELAAEMLSQPTGIDVEVIQKVFLDQRGYATPKVDVRGGVFKDDRLLMVREKIDGRWSMPGGWADVNEPPAAMVEREVWEESGYRVKARKLVGVYESNHDRAPLEVFHAYKLVFLCDLVGGEASTSIETTDSGFFGQDQMPPFSLARTNERIVADVFAHKHDPDLAVTFD